VNVLIVYAHHEPTSFNAAMVSHATSVLTEAGHSVRLSDLYAIEFNPVSDRRNFTTVANAERLDQQAEERHAALNGGFADDIAEEMSKVAWSDLIIFQFPLWWMGMPAIMKGWIDRVFALKFAYGDGRWFERGWLAGKQAMLALTVGGSEQSYSGEGMYGAIDAIVEPIHHGILGFAGFSVNDPFVVYGPGRMDDVARADELHRFESRLLEVAGSPDTMPMRSRVGQRTERNH
jgi:NAD(P)H dehydrogenase (quinone)